MQLQPTCVNDSRDISATVPRKPAEIPTPLPADSVVIGRDPYRLLPLQFLQGPHKVAVSTVPQGWNTAAERGHLCRHLMQEMERYPSRMAILAVGPSQDGNTAVMVASRPQAETKSRPEGIYGVMAEVCSTPLFKAISRMHERVFDGIHPLTEDRSVCEFRLPGRHTANTLFSILSNGIAPNQTSQLRDLLANLPSGRRGAVLLVGPSGAGKTSLIRDLSELSGKRRVSSLSGDMYYRDKDDPDYPRTADGKYDWDSPQALHLKEFASDVARLLRDGDAEVPIYDFGAVRPGGWRIPVDGVTGVRVPQKRHVALGQDDILVIDSVHATTDEIASQLRALDVPAVTIYVDADNAEDRLVRRLVRDYEERKAPPQQTLQYWDSSAFPGELRFVRPSLLRMDPTRDLYYVTRFITDMGLTRSQIEERLRQLGIMGVEPTYAALANVKLTSPAEEPPTPPPR